MKGKQSGKQFIAIFMNTLEQNLVIQNLVHYEHHASHDNDTIVCNFLNDASCQKHSFYLYLFHSLELELLWSGQRQWERKMLDLIT